MLDLYSIRFVSGTRNHSLIPIGHVSSPFVREELFERRLTPDLESRLIERMTETLLEVLDAPELKEHTWVIVEGHDAHRWGRNAKPWDEGGS